MDENGQPKLTDFGIARALDATQVTQTGMYLGTARYSSPEQLQGKETTTKSDVYSLGATLYEAVTGDPPFAGTPIEIASQHVSKPPLPPGERAPVDEWVEALILECLAKNPDDRPTAATVERRLKNLGQGTGVTRRYAVAGAAGSEATGAGAPTDATRAVSAGESRPAGGSRRRAPVAVAIVAVLALIGALGAYALLGGENRAQTPASTTQETVQQTTGEQAQEPQTVAVPAPTTEQPVTQPPPSNPNSQQGSQAEQAAQVTRDIYHLAAAGDYGRSYDLLSRNFKQSQAPTQAQWSGQFDTLERISFLEGPDVRVSGDTARASGVTRAVHTDRTERNTVTWNLVRENGGWKLDGVDIRDKEVVG